LISTVSNIAPGPVAELVRRFAAGDVAGARRIHYELLPLALALFFETNPIPVKTALAILGRIPSAVLRLPLTEMAKKNRDRLEAALAELPRA
ncbi:MAG: 4-hydroxy-tetrahydrodipicolinate synthase, partial [Deltaproteobacteria bacterium]|nr:4-hydroxy-tetrahydrodipicolinate synthase [Deltaproteobacteria bacterium]